jgi:L-seryl-tRNA(Ser) seleniumtransferase
MGATPDLRRRIPAVDVILQDRQFAAAEGLYGRELVRVQVRRALDELRAEVSSEGLLAEELDRRLARLPQLVNERLGKELGRPMARVLNATGIFLHTNLGRAPLPRGVVERIRGALDAYCDLEFRLADGCRGDRNQRVEGLLQAATGAEAGIVVNNNTAALVLILSSLAARRDVVVSRGELVEIGGSFRIPDILEMAGVRLVEVGTTNRTRASDYERAIGPRTGLLLKVFPSNYRQIGFTSSVDVAQLVAVGRRHGVAVAVDEGSGLLLPHRAPQLAGHPSLRELVAAGCDLACGSGDKLLGGPQAGLIVGRRELVESCRRNPLYRALRPDRFTYAGIEELLRLHITGSELPIDRLWSSGEEYERRLRRLSGELDAEVVEAEAFVGGGSAPERPIVGEALSLPGLNQLLEELRTGDPPVVGYLREGRLILDPRTVDPADDEVLIGAVRAARARLER